MEPKTYNYQQAYEASLKYFDGDELAARVWATKYALDRKSTRLNSSHNA